MRVGSTLPDRAWRDARVAAAAAVAGGGGAALGEVAGERPLRRLSLASVSAQSVDPVLRFDRILQIPLTQG